MINRTENLRRAREARWSDPAQRQALAERNRARTGKVTGSSWRRTKPGKASMITISPTPAKVEPVSVREIQFLSDLRLSLLTNEELAAKFGESQARVQQLSRLAGPLALNASGDLAQERVNMLAMQTEIQRRQLARCQREQATFNSSFAPHEGRSRNDSRLTG